MDTPISYARAIAYLGDASKIRARTCDMFGRSPPLATLQRIVTERRRDMAPLNLKGAGEPDDTDERDFAVRGLGTPMRPQPKRPTLAFVPPIVARKMNLNIAIPGELAVIVADAFGLTRSTMLGSSRKANVVAARSVYIKLLRERKTADGEQRYSLKQIATMVKRNDHTTVCHMLETYEPRARHNPQIGMVYTAMKAMGA